MGAEVLREREGTGYPNGFNHEFYAKIFETMLRLKANYLW